MAHDSDKLKMIAELLAGISQDINDVIEKLGAGEEARKVHEKLLADQDREVEIRNKARLAAAEYGFRVYLYPGVNGSFLRYTAPSKYHEGSVMTVNPDGSSKTVHYDGVRGDD